MKKLLITFFLSPLAIFAQVKTAETTFELNTKESRINWKSPSATGNGHVGFIQPKLGSLIRYTNGFIKSGNFIIDMNSIRTGTYENPGKSKNGIEEHLKSDDFFSVDKFPASNFVITKVTPSPQPNNYVITGNLTIKGVTNSIMFPAVIVLNKDQLNAKAEITINRTRWGIMYKSQGQSFLTLMNGVKDDLIPNDINLSLNLVFNQLVVK